MSEQTPKPEITAKQAQQLVSRLPLLRYFAVIGLLINAYYFVRFIGHSLDVAAALNGTLLSLIGMLLSASIYRWAKQT